MKLNSVIRAFRSSLLVLVCLVLVSCGGDRQVTRGAALYAHACGICHGGNGRGGGGASVWGLSKTPADLTVLSRNNAGEFPTDRVLRLLEGYRDGTQTGRRMQPMKALASDRSRRLSTAQGRAAAPANTVAVLRYLQSIQKP